MASESNHYKIFDYSLPRSVLGSEIFPASVLCRDLLVKNQIISLRKLILPEMTTYSVTDLGN